MRRTQDIKKIDDVISNVKPIKPKRPSIYTPLVSMVVLSTVTTLLLTIFFGVQQLVNWGNTHKILARTPIEMKIQNPVVIEEVKPLTVISPVVMEELTPKFDTDIEKYICEKFGQMDCKIAVAVAKAESGLRENAININTNGTIDVGIYQINSIHFNKEGCSLKEIADQYKNVDCAYSIWEKQGWNPWVAYTSQSYLEKL